MIFYKHERSSFFMIKLFLDISPKQLDAALPHQIRDWIKTIEIKLNLERNRGLSRHYRYDLNKHLA
ncbi:hypothetical protein [Ahrensia kielensis]|uniref:hypothetical protein n=1 Tax=Ahrensia kielensis TaxID=76980 RepID=UPI0003774C92|nr:hypothetical protein [Ahrensia kielensis]